VKSTVFAVECNFRRNYQIDGRPCGLRASSKPPFDPSFLQQFCCRARKNSSMKSAMLLRGCAASRLPKRPCWLTKWRGSRGPRRSATWLRPAVTPCLSR
jgi:hypothetical protein